MVQCFLHCDSLTHNVDVPQLFANFRVISIYDTTELFLEILNDFHPGGFPDSKIKNEVCLTRISNYMERHGMKKQF